MRKKKTPQRVINSCRKLMLVLSIFSFSFVNAQKGLFAKFSIGPGLTLENSMLNNTGVSLITKNHAIGWGITDKFALQIGEFGGLNKLKSDDYDYINLDAFGVGFSYRFPRDIKLSVLGAVSKVSFAKKWTESFGEDGGKGYGINMSIDKEWFVARRWGLRVGPRVYFLKTIKTDYQFFNISINGSVVFYLTPVRSFVKSEKI